MLSVIYCWITKDHPDPEGYHLATLAHILEIFSTRAKLSQTSMTNTQLMVEMRASV